MQNFFVLWSIIEMSLWGLGSSVLPKQFYYETCQYWIHPQTWLLLFPWRSNGMPELDWNRICRMSSYRLEGGLTLRNRAGSLYGIFDVFTTRGSQLWSERTTNKKKITFYLFYFLKELHYWLHMKPVREKIYGIIHWIIKNPGFFLATMSQLLYSKSFFRYLSWLVTYFGMWNQILYSIQSSRLYSFHPVVAIWSANFILRFSEKCKQATLHFKLPISTTVMLYGIVVLFNTEKKRSYSS